MGTNDVNRLMIALFFPTFATKIAVTPRDTFPEKNIYLVHSIKHILLNFSN